EPVLAHVLAVAGLFEATVRHLVEDREVVVQPDAAVLQLADRAQAPAGALGPDRGGEAVLDVVGPCDRLVVVRELLHRDDGPEDLLLDDLGALRRAGHDRRRAEEAAAPRRVAARRDPGAGRRRPLEEPEHALLLAAGDDG